MGATWGPSEVHEAEGLVFLCIPFRFRNQEARMRWEEDHESASWPWTEGSAA